MSVLLCKFDSNLSTEKEANTRMPPKKSTNQAKSAAAVALQSTECHTITFSAKGEIKKAKLALTDGALTVTAIQTYLKKKTEPVELGSYTHEGATFFLYGYKEGKSGTENKYEFPPPYDALQAYGDVVLIASMNGVMEEPVSFLQAQWDTFYEQIAGGGFIASDIEEEEVVVDEDEEEIDAVPSDNEGDDDEDNVANDDVVDDEEDEELYRKPAAKKKKSSTVISSGFQKQVALQAVPGFKELSITDSSSKIQLRMNVIQLLSFLPSIGFKKEDATILEESIYGATFVEAERRNVTKHWDNPLFVTLYQTNIRTICSQLHPSSPIKNPRLLERIQLGEVTLQQISYMTPQEMFPENWKELSDRQAIREQKLLEGNKRMATDRYKCGRCGKRECSYYEMQTRSADEPMTIFISCLNCGKRWRQ